MKTLHTIKLVVKVASPTGTDVNLIELEPGMVDEEGLTVRISFAKPVGLWRVAVLNGVIFLPEGCGAVAGGVSDSPCSVALAE